MSDSKRYLVGIDLGTTHSVLSFVDGAAEGGTSLAGAANEEEPKLELLGVPQLQTPTTLDDKPMLPSFVYLAHEAEPPLALPWDAERRFAVGELARRRGEESPGRVVMSAKSWLSHAGVDRRSPLLPPSAPADVEKISPVEASFRVLEHLCEALQQQKQIDASEAEVVLTVPASFDATARELTVEAALAAGLENVTLLEEPQAALYAWTSVRGDAWRKELTPGDVLLVVDVGGGTTDFSAILVGEQDGSLSLERIAVGDHVLLGGDNMDLLLAHVVQQKLEAEGKSLDTAQAQALVHQCRSAKEKLLGAEALESIPIALASKGAKLVGGTLRTELTRAEIEQVVLAGFFPEVAVGEKPKQAARSALRTLGLPYATDAAITRQLSGFLVAHRDALPIQDESSAKANPPILLPTVVLFNGGVMKSDVLRQRVLAALQGWARELGAPEVRELGAADYDLAVARGAALYGLARRGRGLRVRGGTARAYYVGIESNAPAIPGVEPPVHLLCIASMGMEEGTRAELTAEELGLVVGEPARFRFFASSVRRADRPGALLDRWSKNEFDELAPVEVTLESASHAAGEVLAVHLEAEVTAIGTLVVEAVSASPAESAGASKERWKVELVVRGT